MIKIQLTLLFFSCLTVSFCQVDFNNFKTTYAKGPIPSDFSNLTYKKIKEDLDRNQHEMSKIHERVFLRQIHYGIDEILHSGMVVYGDEISQYIGQIAGKLLENEQDLLKKLRFYVLKSNETNAFSTDQGIVFVTTGLISQLSNEAQLAFVLAHEISHYTQKHVVESFEYRVANYGANIRDLSIYSKEKELEADKFGLRIYHEAGYSKEELITAFDVIMYSYLPFDEVEFSNEYFNTSQIYIPKSFFPEKKYPIKAVEDYDDSRSSHPNIKKRKEEALKLIDEYSTWGNNKFFFGNKLFEYIRNICRFEHVRNDVLEANYADALYSISILEVQFPSSIFLKRMKAQSWLGLYLYKINGNINETVNKTANFEGEIATVHYFIKKMNKDAVASVALRIIYDLAKENSKNKELQLIYDKLIKELVKSTSFKIENYSTKKYFEAQNEIFQTKENTKAIVDTVSALNEKKTKYEKIKGKKIVENQQNFDSSKFYIYALSDVIQDSCFIHLFDVEKKLWQELVDKDLKFNNLSFNERKKIIKQRNIERLNLGQNQFIVVEPMVISRSNSIINFERSERLKHDFSIVLESAALDAGVKIFTIDRDHLETSGTISFNQRNVLFSFMSQVSKKDDYAIFPVDYQLLQEIDSTYNTDKVLFILANHNHSAEKILTSVIFSILFPPSLPFSLPHRILSSNTTEIDVIVFDIEKGILELGESYFMNEKPKKHHLGAHMFNIFSQLIIKPSLN